MLDLDSGQPVAVRSMLNRQQPFGADVITRISATMMDPDALAACAIASTRRPRSSRSRSARRRASPRRVYEVAVAGNVTMTQLVLGIDPEPLVVAPFVVSTHSFAPLTAPDLGVKVHPRATAYVFPSLGRLRRRRHRRRHARDGLTRDRRIRLFIDVGTNCEIVLGSVERVLTTAAPAGPAFEAAQIRCGMRAADGAIETIKIDGDTLKVGVIGDVEAHGLCGSGLVDACAELAREGFIDESGRYLTDEAARALNPSLADRLVMRGEERVFVLHWKGDDSGSRSSSPSATSASCSSPRPRSRPAGRSSSRSSASRSRTSRRCCSRAASARTSPLSAVRIGLVPKLPVARIIAAGNVAGEGAKMVLLSAQERAQAYSMLEEVEYVELSGREDFQDMFVDLLKFPR